MSHDDRPVTYSTPPPARRNTGAVLLFYVFLSLVMFVGTILVVLALYGSG